MLYKAVRALAKVYLKLAYRVKFYGEENLPADGGYILCGNHVSALDPFFLACGMRKDCAFIAKAELFKFAFIRMVAKSFNIYPIKRGTGDIGGIKKAISVVNDGKPLVMFPEGTRSKDGKLGEGKNGVSLIAKKTGCFLVPCAINAKPRLFTQSKVIYGKPFKINEVNNSEELTAETTRLMKEISNLLEELNENH